MNILITGGGLIGTALQARLLKAGYSLTVLTRNAALIDRERVRFIISLDDIAADEQFHAFINLAGESMAQGRWTTQRNAQQIEQLRRHVSPRTFCPEMAIGLKATATCATHSWIPEKFHRSR